MQRGADGRSKKGRSFFYHDRFVCGVGEGAVALVVVVAAVAVAVAVAPVLGCRGRGLLLQVCCSLRIWLFWLPSQDACTTTG